MTASASFDFSNATGRIEDGSRAFALQYTSLMLTILSFVVGAFAGNKLEDARPAKIEVSRKLPEQTAGNAEPALSTVVYEDLFIKNPNATGLTDKASALSILLNSHDLKIVGEISANDGASAGSGRFEHAMQRARVLEQYFIAQGVPANAIELFATDSADAPQARLQIERSAKRSSLQNEARAGDQ